MNHVPVTRRELVGWAMYDFANSGYTTVVLTAIFNAYFVRVIAGGEGGVEQGTGTLLWAIAVAAANALVLLSAPLLGAIADHLAIKKRILLISTVGCVTCTALLALAGPGDIVLAMTLVLLASVMFASGENLISAFLPELSEPERMGRISGYGWGLGYLGGILTLGLCLAYIAWARKNGIDETRFIPVTLLITAVIFALATMPTFLWLRERAVPSALPPGVSLLRVGFSRLYHTLREAARYRDLFRFLVALSVYQSGVATVVVLAAVYAQQVVGFNTQQLIVLILVINITSSIGAFLFGFLQDRIGSVRALTVSLGVWIAAIIVAFFADTPADLWLTGNLVGLAMGASQAVGRALVGQFTPVAYTGEFFGLWGMSNRLAAIIGPMSYGLVNFCSGGDHRVAILSTLVFLVAGLGLLTTVNEQRGKAAALAG